MTSSLETRINDILDQLSLADMAALLSGEDFWSVTALPEHGIGKLRVTDGPNGARGSGSFFQDGAERVSSACFPVGIAMGATWNTDLIYDMAQAIGQETKSKGAQVCLAPTVNIHRSVTNGRNFECFSEDPELAAALTTAYVQGLQSQGIAPTIKHFAGNESEIERTTIDSQIDERTLREVYLRPFEAAVKDAQAWGIMSSYNKLNGTYTAENKWLLSDVLRGEWGFDGVVISDWFGSRTTGPTINAGLDLEMPGPTRDRGDKIAQAIAAGETTLDDVRDRARNMLRLMARVGVLDDMPPYREITDDRPEHRALIRKAGAEAMVLLKNDTILPLTDNGQTIAVIGPNAQTAQIMGGGSSQLNPHYRISPWDGLVDRLGMDRLTYAAGCQNHRWEPLIQGDITVEFFAFDDLGGTVLSSMSLQKSIEFLFPDPVHGKISQNHFSCRARVLYTAQETGIHSFGLHSAGRSRLLVDGTPVVDIWDDWTKGRTFFEEGCDERTGEIELVTGQTYLIEMQFQTVPATNLINPAFRFGVSVPLGTAAIEQAATTAQAADTVILCIGRSGEWDTEGSDLENITLPKQQDDLARAVLDANPNTIIVLQTGGPVEMPWLDAAPAVLQAWYPGQELGNALADVLFGDAEPSGRLPQSFPQKWSDNPTQNDDPSVYPGANGAVQYAEGVFQGYRHYDAHGIAPLFPFGHGLGYTSFEIHDMMLDHQGDHTSIICTLENTGARSGHAVLQTYVSAPESGIPRPIKELKAFAKTHLEAGETRQITLTLGPRAFAYFDVTSDVWRVSAGQYNISLGFSATDLRITMPITRSAQTITK